MSKELPKTIQNQTPPQTALHIHDKLSLQVLVIVIEAHLHNMVQPGSFNSRLNEILEINNFPKVNLPEPVHSNEIFNIINSMPEYAARTTTTATTRDVEMEEEEEDDDDESSSGSIEIENETRPEVAAATHTADTATTTKHSKKMVTLPPKPPHEQTQERTTQKQQQQQKRQQQQQQTKQQQEQQGVRPKQQMQRSETGQTGKTKSHGSEAGLTFYTYPHSGILETMAPEPLYRNIRERHVKFTYEDDRLSEAEVLKYIRDETLNTNRNKVKTVDESVYRKIRNGLITGSPKEATVKQRQRFSSQ